jgi:ankyrin repeat protein
MLKADSSLAAIRDESRDTPLHIAATCGNLGAIEPLLRAVLMGKVAAAERLVAAGANVNLADKFHTTPLHMAVMRKNLQMVKLLVESGADVNVSETSDGCMTPLFMAQTYKATAIAAYLRQHGAKLRVPGLPEQH